MIEAIGDVTGARESVVASGPPGGALGKDEFLRLLVAQLRDQDPLSPMEADELAVQLAQFSSVEQLMNLNERIAELGAFDSALAEMVSASAAVGLLGKDVTAVTDRISLDGSGQAPIDVDVRGAGGVAIARIVDASGVELATLPLGPLAPGRQTVDFGALDQRLPPGTYRFEIEVDDGSGTISPAVGVVQGKVTGVRYVEGGPVLVVGSMELPLASVIEVGD